jgi:hypothetical protein
MGERGKKRLMPSPTINGALSNTIEPHELSSDRGDQRSGKGIRDDTIGCTESFGDSGSEQARLEVRQP